MKSSRSARSRHISFGMTALIDMAFLLITFFVMSIRFGQTGEERIKLPDADQAKDVADQRVELITVNVTKDGTYLLNAVQRTPEQLASYLDSRKAASDKEIELVIRGDRQSAFDAIQRVMRISAEAGIANVGLAALQLGGEENTE